MDDADLQKPEELPSLISPTNSSLNIADPEPEQDEHRYTSLKNLILGSSSFSMTQDDFYSSKILIRNQLVKSAASLTSNRRRFLLTRDQSRFLNLWGKLKNSVGTSCSCSAINCMPHEIFNIILWMDVVSNTINLLAYIDNSL
ncbi:hypothetical protein HRI_002270400 [Hibiscus trionum]|uniref:Uncharacterized protein n=1 Tax=Hibiscus trionum TaxID=183268 RepID=A0A9W7HZ39_HIBTR|nr:hypothetical protein HRI_002270400 [Hibiscus trionum]